MTYGEKRRWKKRVQSTRHQLRHALNMREDVASAADVEAAVEADVALRTLWASRDWKRLAPACESAEKTIDRLQPPRAFPRWRENIEVFVVAISLAMACKCFFIQPFKIPTGSMQPTLNGILAYPQEGRAWSDYPPFNLLKLAVFGEYYTEVRAKTSGIVGGPLPFKDQYAFSIGGIPHPIRMTPLPDSAVYDPARSMQFHVQPGDRVEKGQLLATGRVIRGDQVFVNKVMYHFTRPKRGQIIVFDTNFIPHKERLHIMADTFYIKRLVGLPGETVSIRDRYAVVDGRPVEEPYPFARQVLEPGYRGYVTRVGAILNSSASSIQVGDKQFLPFGDNTYSSLDGRYFGPVSEKALVGPAFFVYWPFGPHWGRLR
ncbi:MAG: signal peptidase I [Verrucomicrobiota bacterium]|jgi:signal peptidase I|nr:signal peptidase I [Verrucomicrobiota bacterium]